MTDLEELKKRLQTLAGTEPSKDKPWEEGWRTKAVDRGVLVEVVDAIEQLQRKLEEARFSSSVYQQIMDVAERYGRAQIAIEFTNGERWPLIYAAGSGFHDSMKIDADEIARLKRELEEARRDAGRYRWIVENAVIEFGHVRNNGLDPASTKQPLDNAIDAAMQKEG